MKALAWSPGRRSIAFVAVADRVELVTNASNFIRAYDPDTGKEL